MASTAANIRQRILDEHPNAELVERGRSHLTHKIGVDALTGAEIRKAVFTQNPLHYQSAGSWQEIDTDWQDSDDPSFADKMDRADYRVYSGADGRRRIYPRRDRFDEYVEFQAPELRNPVGRWRPAQFGGRGRSGNRLEWQTLGASVETTATPSRFKVNFILQVPQLVAPIRWRYNTVGLRRDGSLLISESDGAVVASFDPFVMIDAEGTERLVASVFTNSEIELYPETTGLVFPVTVDPTTTFYTTTGTTGDGYLEGGGASYGAAYGDTTPTVDTPATLLYIGQRYASLTYFVYQSFLGFDTSSIGAAATITGAEFDFWVATDASTTNFDITLAAYDFGTAIDAPDFHSPTQLTALTAAGSLNTSTVVTTAYSVIAGIQSVVNPTGNTRVILYSDRNASATSPSGDEYIRAYATEATGTANDPYFSVTYTTTQTYDETAGTSVVLVQTAGSDAQVMAETSGLTTLLARVAGTDSLTIGETVGTVLALVTTSGADTQVMNEGNGSVVILALIDGTETFGGGTTYTETSGSVLALVQTDGADTQTFVETAGLTTVLAVMGGADGLVWPETAGVVLTRAVVSGVDTEQMVETASEVTVLAISEGVDALYAVETGGEIVVLMMTDGEDALAFRFPSSFATLNLRLVNPYDSALQKR